MGHVLRRRFQPIDLSRSTLEERVGLSHAGAVVAVPGDDLTMPVQGIAVTRLPASPGGAYDVVLDGKSAHSQFGPIHSISHLSSKPSLATPYSNTEGVMRVTSPRGPGVMLTVLSGNPSTLQNGDESLNFSVTKSTGIFAGALGDQGHVMLSLSTTVDAHHHQATGHFTLRQWLISLIF